MSDDDLRALIERLRKRLEVPYEKTCLAADALERLLAERTRDTARICDLVSDVARLEQERDGLREDAERYRAIREARKMLKIYVYEDPNDTCSGDWLYKPSPEDIDAFADAARGAS